MFCSEFSEISFNTFLKEPSDGCFCLNTRSVYCPTRTFCFFKNDVTHFPAEYFSGLIYRLGTRVSSIFQTLRQALIFKRDFYFHLRCSIFFLKIVNSLKLLSVFSKKLRCRCLTRFWKSRDDFKTSWMRKNYYAEDVLNTSSRYVLKTSSRRLEDQQMFAGNVFLSLFSMAAIIRKNYNSEARDESNHVKEKSVYFKPTLHFTLHKKWSFPLRISLLMWPNPQETADLDTFTEEILNGKLHFLCSFNLMFPSILQQLLKQLYSRIIKKGKWPAFKKSVREMLYLQRHRNWIFFMIILTRHCSRS